MPAVPLPDQGTRDLLNQAYGQARSELKGQVPDSLLQPFTPSAIPPQGSATLSVSTPPPGAESISAPDAPPAGATPYGADVESTPPEDAQPVTGKPPAFQGFWNELGNQTMKSMVEAGKGLANVGWGAFIQAASALPGDHSKDAETADAGFKAIEDTFSPAIEHWQGNVQANAATTGKGAKIAAGVLGGAAPLALGPEAFLAQATMNAGTDSVDESQDLKTAYTLAGINLMANAAGMKVPFKSPNVVKRILANGAYGATVSAASEWLTKKFLNDGGYKEAADNIDPTDPTTLATSGLISAIFGYLEKPAIRKGFEERGGKVPGSTPPAPDATPVQPATPEPVKPVSAAPAADATPAPPEAGPSAAVPDHPTAEPLSDLQAQVADMRDPATPRKAVYLAPDNVKQLGPEGVGSLAEGSKQIRNFDGKGGVLIVPDVETARTARDLKKAEPDMQKVLGQLTGAGDGKTTADSIVVQGQTPEGAVATEGAVTPEEVPNKVAEVQAQGKTPVVTTAKAALQRRAAAVEAGPPKGAEPVESVPDSAPEAAAPEKPAAQEAPGEAIEPPPATELPPKSALEQTMATLAEQEKPAKGRKLVPLKDRMANAASAGAALKAAALAAHGKGLDEALVSRANSAANEAVKLGSKSDEQIAKGQGTGHPRVTAIVDEMQKAARTLEGRAQPGDEAKVPTRAAVLKARVNKSTKAAVEEIRAKRRDFFTPGNIVEGYGGTHDRVLSYNEKPDGEWSTRVEEVEADSDGGWKTIGSPREHATAPGKYKVMERPIKVDKAPAKVVKEPVESSQSATPEKPKSAPAEKPSSDENTITVKPHIIRGREMEALVKEVGVDPADIAEAAEKATGTRRGALTAFLQELANGMDVNKGWLPHMSALNPERSKSSPLNRSQHIQMKNLIARFARAGVEGAGHARDALDNFMQDINGKRLDDRTQAAVHKYAEARRRMEVLKDKFGDETHEDEDDSQHDAVTMAAARRGRPIEGELESQDGYTHSGDRLLSELTARADKDPALSRMISQAHAAGQPVRLHDVLDELLRTAPAGPAKSILQAVRRFAGDVPVHFVDNVLSRSSGEAMERAGGLYSHSAARGIEDIQVKLNSTRHPLRVLLHEAVHAATFKFMRANPTHEFTLRVERLRQTAMNRAINMFGRDVVQAHWEYWNGLGEKPATEKFVPDLYGLTNKDEFLAEALSNDRFQNWLNQSEKFASPGEKIGSLINKLGAAIRHLFGITDGAQGRLFDEVMFAAHDVMKAQHESLNAAHERMAGLDDILGAPMHDLAELRSLDEEAPRLRNEDEIMRDKPESARPILRAYNHVIKSKAWDSLTKNLMYAQQMDWLVRRHARFFGGGDDPANPLRRWMDVRDQRVGVQNRQIERASEVGDKWMRLSPAQNKRLGQFMADSTMWGIDPTIAKDKHSLTTQGQRGYDARYDDFQSRWNNLSSAEQEVYEGARDANKWQMRESRKAAVNVALNSVDHLITPAERERLYNVKDPREYDSLIGDDKLIDLADRNDAVKSALKDLASLHEIDGPYFHLGREGTKVVQVEPEGSKEFASREQAEAFAGRVRELGPASTATVAERGGKHVVDYNAHYVSFHDSANGAEADAARMRAQGFEVGGVTEKVLTKDNAPLSHGMRELVTEAQRKIESHGKDDGTEAATQALTSAFLHLMAARSAFAGSKLARKGVAGVKPEEMRMNFARHATATAWHTANMTSMFDEAGAMAKLREAARNRNVDQSTLYQRGRVVSELNRRAQDLVQNYGVKSPYSTTMSQLNYMKFLFSPAHAGIWLTQNITVGVPKLGAKYGYGRAASALLKSSTFMPALKATMKGLLSKPGNVTASDISKSVVDSMRADPALARWTKGENSPLQQLMDRGAIGSSLSSELSSVSKGNNQTIAKVMEWARLMPHMADLYNRLSTGIAALELTNGDVSKSADLIREIHVDYSADNQSGLFKTVKRIPVIGPSVAALKTYVQGMTHLMLSNMMDVMTGEGSSRADAAKVLAGLYVGSAIFTGVSGSTPFPARLIAYAYNKIFGDDDKYYDLDNSVRRFLTDHFGQSAGQMIAGGVPRALGFDLSHRMGLADLPFHNVPDLLGPQSATDKLKDFVFSMAGTLPQMLGETMDGFMQHMHRGELFQAFASAVPVKAINDAQKAYDMAENGRRTKMGGQVMGSDRFTGADSALQSLGLKPAKVADVQERQGTQYDYKDWAQGRKQQLIAAYMSAAPADRGDVQTQISQWNAKNPGVRITRSDLIRQMRTNVRAGQLGQGRDPEVNRLLNY